jgi:DNA-binding MarR family transcriptional regulator
MTRSTSSATTEATLEHFGSLMRHVAGWHAPEFLEVDVTMAQAKCLYMVSLHPGISMSAMAEQLHVGLSAVSGLVERLVEHGHVERHEDPADRRQQLLSLTNDGRAVIERIRELNDARLRRLLQGLNVTELEALSMGIAALARQARLINQNEPTSTAPGHERNPA